MPLSIVQKSAVSPAANRASLRLPHPLARLEELRQALALSQQDSRDARQQVELLIEANAKLWELAVKREHEVAKVRRFAYHDELTGLPNRTLLADRLKQALIQAKRHDKQLALLFLDLDGFKNINDSFGHAAGDKLLHRVAARLLSCIRGGDTACRYGGDEFILLLPEVDDEKRAQAIAQKIRVRLAKAYLIDDHLITVTASIGVAVYPENGTSQNDLIMQADMAMYLAKAVAISRPTVVEG